MSRARCALPVDRVPSRVEVEASRPVPRLVDPEVSPWRTGEPMRSRRVREDDRMIDVEQVRAALESHRALLVEIDAGRVEASGVQRAYLVGSADVLARLVDGDLDVTPAR